MKVVLQLPAPWDFREVGQCGWRVKGFGLYLVDSIVAISEGMTEVLLICGIDSGCLELYKVDKALGEVTKSCFFLETGLVGGHMGPPLTQLQLAGCPAQEIVLLPQLLQVFPPPDSLQQPVGTLHKRHTVRSQFEYQVPSIDLS